MPVNALDRSSGLSTYATLDQIRTDPSLRAAVAADPDLTDPRPLAPVGQSTTAGRFGLDNLAASARAAAVALATSPRAQTATTSGLGDVTAQAQRAALAAATDPFDRPTPREVAQIFATVAALVPFAPTAVEDDEADDRVSKVEATAATGDLTSGATPENQQASVGGRYSTLGSRVSRFV